VNLRKIAISLTDPEARFALGSAMDSPELPHNPQSTANERDSRYAQPPQVSGRLLTPATLHSQVGGRVGSLLVPFPPATPIPPCVKCEMFLRRQEAQKSVSKKQQRAEEEHGHKHPILCRIHACRRWIVDKSRLRSKCGLQSVTTCRTNTLPVPSGEEAGCCCE
jgi:hypothetical protein